MNGNLCRCMTYPRIVKAIKRAAIRTARRRTKPGPAGGKHDQARQNHSASGADLSRRSFLVGGGAAGLVFGVRRAARRDDRVCGH